MLRLITIAFVTAMFTLPATAQPVCMERDNVLNLLASEHAETPVAVGLSNDGRVVEVAASADGTWTVFLTNPDRISCVMASGVAWRKIEANPALAARM